MKNFGLIILFYFLVSSSKAQTSNTNKQTLPDSCYCLTVKGDINVLFFSGKEVKEARGIKLRNGDWLSPEGRIKKMNRTEIKLKKGECVTLDGSVISPDKK